MPIQTTARFLDRQDIDAVDVCVHPGPHLEITRAAAAAGKHILMEKPMCCNVAEGDEMIAAAENAGVLLMVAYMMRFDSGLHQTKIPIRRWHAWYTADGVFQSGRLVFTGTAPLGFL